MVEKLSVEIALEGGEELQRQFAAATSSIAKLGNTAEEAFAGASAAAQKFGASTADLGKVETIISALSARARDGSLSFSELAKNYDAARQSAGSFVAAATKVEEATKKTGVSASEARSAVNALAQGLNVMGAGPMGRIATAVANIGTRFGALALAGTAIGGTTAALIKFANAAGETEKALTQLQKVSGQSFANLSALSRVFAQGGTPLKQFATEFGNLSEKIAGAGEQAAKQEATKKQAEDIAKGLKGAELPAITLNERVNAILETLSRTPPTEQWSRLADIFKSLGSDAERARVGQALVLSPESIATLSQGSEKLQQMTQQAQQLGLALDGVDQKNLSGLREGQTQASALFDALKDKMGALVAPAVASFWEGFTARLQELIPVFTQIASSIGQVNFASLGAAAADFLAILAKIGAGWASIISGQTKFSDVLLEVLRQAGQGLVSLAVDIGTAIGKGIIEGIISAIQSGIGSVVDLIKRALGFGGSAPATGGAGAGGQGFAGGGLVGGGSSGTSVSHLAIRPLGHIPSFAAGGVAGGGDQLWDFLNRVTDQLDAALGELTNGLVNHVLRIAKMVETPMHALLGLMNQIKGNARGGLLGGRGSGTSDSNLAWVSRGEYIIPARAVAQPGMLALLEALRRSGGNLRGVLDGMGRFALGGMVPRAMPAFAAGGLAGGNLGTLTLGLPSGGSVTVRASSGVADQLRKEAALAQVRSGGRKPSRYS
jgi:hypothetical protein